VLQPVLERKRIVPASLPCKINEKWSRHKMHKMHMGLEQEWLGLSEIRA